jgi:hypothetical protein
MYRHPRSSGGNGVDGNVVIKRGGGFGTLDDADDGTIIGAK